MQRAALFLGEIILIVVFAVDRVLKAIVEGQSASASSRLISFGAVQNTGAVFGVPVSNTVAIGIMIGVMIIVVWLVAYALRRAARVAVLAASAVLLGALSNIVDRILTGGVIDYITIRSLSVTNIADVLIVVGAIILALRSPLTSGLER